MTCCHGCYFLKQEQIRDETREEALIINPGLESFVYYYCLPLFGTNDNTRWRLSVMAWMMGKIRTRYRGWDQPQSSTHSPHSQPDSPSSAECPCSWSWAVSRVWQARVCDVSAREPASGDQGWSCHPVRSQRESEVRILFVPRQILDQVLDQDQLRHQQHCQCHPHHSQTSGSRQEDICRSQVGKIWLCWY